MRRPRVVVGSGVPGSPAGLIGSGTLDLALSKHSFWLLLGAMAEAGEALRAHLPGAGIGIERAFFRRRVNYSHEADDLTQETDARVLCWTTRRVISEPRSALFRIARNLLVDRARRASRDWLQKVMEVSVTFAKFVDFRVGHGFPALRASL